MDKEQVKNITIGIIGAGRVGKTFGFLLKKEGFNVSGFYSRTFESALYAAEFTETKAFKTISELLNNSSVILLSVPDSKLKSVALKLEKLINTKRKKFIDKHTVIFFSGSVSSLDLKPIFHSFYVGSCHPMYAFSTVEDSIKNLEGTLFTLEGDGKALDFALKIVEAVKGRPFFINSKDKAKYHLACYIASPLYVSLFSEALLIFDEMKLDMAKRGLLKLSYETLKNLESLDPKKALTGPVVRGDYTVILSHLEAIRRLNIKSKKKKILKNIYTFLTLNSLDLVAKRNFGIKRILGQKDKDSKM